jgi:hypothetical protein
MVVQWTVVPKTVTCSVLTPVILFMSKNIQYQLTNDSRKHCEQNDPMLTVHFYRYPIRNFYWHTHPIRKLKLYSTWGGLHKNYAHRILIRRLRSVVYCRILKSFIQSHVLASRQPEKPSVNNAHGSRFCENYSFGAPSGSNDNNIKFLRLNVFTI